MSVAIIGCGASGSLCLLELARKGRDLSTITVIDPYFDGGDLGRRWGAVKSNTKWQQIVDSMSQYPSAAAPIAELGKAYGPEDIFLLSDLANLLQQAARPLLQSVNLHVDTCKKLKKTEAGWSVDLAAGGEVAETFGSVFLCQGGVEKQLDYGKPVIPLDIALDPVRLRRLIRPGQTVTVVGLSHSGTLALRNLNDLGLSLNGIYDTEKPFYFARDGCYDGIKEEAATIADTIVAKTLPVKLVSTKDTKNLVKVLTKTDWIVLSIGFTTRSLCVTALDGTQLNEVDYSPTTALVAGQADLYGFGLSYPGVSEIEGKIYKDVSIPSFIQQIQRCLAEI
jgi:hypothetical protein